MKVTPHTNVAFTVTLELDEADARALHVLSQFGGEETYDAIIKRLTSSFSREAVSMQDWIVFMRKIQDQVGPGLRAVRDARELLKKVKP